MRRKSWSIILVLFLLLVSLRANAAQTASAVTFKFISCIDGQEDLYALRLGKASHPSRFDKNVGKPINSALKKNNVDSNKASNVELSGQNTNGILIVYLHSMNGDFNEPFKVNSGLTLADAINKEFPAVNILSCNYGKTPSWGNAVAKVDITRNIRKVMESVAVKKIILVGTSMGASTALTYAATAPLNIKEKIVGVIAVSPCANYEDLYNQSKVAEVKSSLEAAFGGNPDQKPLLYRQNSLDACIPFLLPALKVGVVLTDGETVIPVDLQKDVLRDLGNHDMNFKSIEIEGKSEPLPDKSILEAMHYILQT